MAKEEVAIVEAAVEAAEVGFDTGVAVAKETAKACYTLGQMAASAIGGVVVGVLGKIGWDKAKLAIESKKREIALERDANFGADFKEVNPNDEQQ